MILPSDYNTAQAFSGERQQQRLSVGGHICRIRTATVKNTQYGDCLDVTFDVQEGSEFDNFYKEQFENDKQRYGNNAYWKGNFRAYITTSEGKTNGRFKGFIQSVEESNSGYNFVQSGANEISLQGKYVGFNFREEEYKNNNGDVRCTVRPAFAVSAARVREGVSILPKKRIAENGASSASQSYTAPAQPQQPAAPYDEDDDLPF